MIAEHTHGESLKNPDYNPRIRQGESRIKEEAEKMDLRKIRDLIDIKPSGAILVGRHITIDGFERRPIHIITHAHADHLGGENDPGDGRIALSGNPCRSCGQTHQVRDL